MMNRVFLIVVLVAGVVSCGTMRQVTVRQEADASLTEVRSDTTSMELLVMGMIDRRLSESIDRLLQQEIVIETEELSMPDTTGRQYVRERSRTTVTTRASEMKRTAKTDSSSIAVQKDSTSAMSSASDATVYQLSSEDMKPEQKASGVRNAVKWIFTGILLSVALFIVIKARVLWR